MASKDKHDATPGGGVARMRDAAGRGDLKMARSIAWEILHDDAASETDRAEAERLRSHTEVDRRAWGIAAFAVGLAALVIVLFLL